jgi:hypothetical protein
MVHGDNAQVEAKFRHRCAEIGGTGSRDTEGRGAGVTQTLCLASRAMSTALNQGHHQLPGSVSGPSSTVGAATQFWAGEQEYGRCQARGGA